MDFTSMPRWLLARLGLTPKGRLLAPEDPDPSALDIEKKGPERGSLEWWRERFSKWIAAAPSGWVQAQRRLAEAFHFLSVEATGYRWRKNSRGRQGPQVRGYPIPLPPTLMGAPARLRRRGLRWLAREKAKRSARGDTSPISLPRELRWPR